MSQILKMQDICKDYQVGRSSLRVLKDINLEVEEGDYLAIMGPSGSGKTTLMNLIGCLDTPTSGEYYLDGRNITKCSDNQLAEIRNGMIGFVFQSFNLLPKMSAVDNVALPLLYAGVRKSERIRRAQEALKAVGLEDRMSFRQDQLSGGQCQRVAIARAMVVNPGILLADEPTGALDSESGRQIMALFREIHEQGTTVIMITHDANIAANADHIVYIRDGELYIDEADITEASAAEYAAEITDQAEPAEEVWTTETDGQADMAEPGEPENIAETEASGVWEDLPEQEESISWGALPEQEDADAWGDLPEPEEPAEWENVSRWQDTAEVSEGGDQFV